MLKLASNQLTSLVSNYEQKKKSSFSKKQTKNCPQE